jgi:hypothetical protein
MFKGFVPEWPYLSWLVSHASGWQFGEQGILIALADTINPDGQCVEIGAGDGEGLPLTIDPFYRRGNDCVLFEADAVSLGKLVIKYPKSRLCGKFDQLGLNWIDQNASVVVIDVDGHDMQIMCEVLASKTPAILMVEHFDKCHPLNCNDMIQLPSWVLGMSLEHNFTLQNNAATLDVFAGRFGYRRVGTTRVNSIFVHKSHIEKVSR